ncbi:NAD-dependent epimerase/dehydratase family protein [Micromonospora sp. AMSO12t]|uniref:SDR family oxidoreductase n=1 Tax=unclassified Micromonospora TaxID=2617518 RepID=UPI00124B7A82|nr:MULTISPECIES: SDR family oxidoreductase [unclassified Micromonospora]KAB1148542.1 NAD-dependent epimerase/dehydratase family protein [Micromonospora sp. AMSO12t]WSG01213.1 SDR family oxidoreductase [Micromonospora sp. NBC_01740]
MHIFLRHNSDRIALSTGSPNRISLGYSEDPRAVAGRLPRRGADEPKNVLLLGANGYVGMHMLRELLGDARVATVYALVRRKGDKSGEDRIARQLRKYKMELPDTGKLSVLEGSYLEPAMGLDPAAHHELLTEVDVVIDAAGATTHDYPYARYREEKVLPTLRLAEFCLQERFKTLHVIGSVGSEVYQQRRDFYRNSFFYTGYSRMKWVVKHLSLRANRDGVPIHIYQAPFALGGAPTGFKDPGMEYSFWNMISHMLQLGLIWDSEVTSPIVAGDVLARSVVDNALSETPRPISYPVTPATTREIAERFDLKLVSWQEFRRELMRQHRFRPSQIDWSKPITSIKRGRQQSKFVRSLFPRSFHTLLSNIHHAAANPTAVRLDTDLPPIDVLVNNARRIRKLGRYLPEEAVAPVAVAAPVPPPAPAAEPVAVGAV